MTSPAIEPDAIPDPAPPSERDRGLRREALIASAVAVVLAVLGVPLGLLWRAVAPKVEFVMTELGATPVQQEPEGFVAGDGWYVLITFTVGVLAALGVWVFARRRRGPLMLLGLAGGSVAGGVLAAWVGHKIGYAHYRDLAAHAPVGTHFFRPPSVRSGEVGLWFSVLPRVQGAVLVQAVAAATTYLMLAAFHVDPDLRHSTAPADGAPEGHQSPLPGFDQAAAPADQPAPPGGVDQPAPPGGVDQPAPPGGVDQPAQPGGEVSWGPTESTVPPGSPAPPGSDPAEPPRG